MNGQILKTLTERTAPLEDLKTYYVISWCEMGLWAGILKVNGQVLKTLTERELNHLRTSRPTMSSPGVKWDFGQAF